MFIFRIYQLKWTQKTIYINKITTLSPSAWLIVLAEYTWEMEEWHASQYVLSCTQEFLNIDDTLDTLLRLYMNRGGCTLSTEYVSNLAITRLCDLCIISLYCGKMSLRNIYIYIYIYVYELKFVFHIYAIYIALIMTTE